MTDRYAIFGNPVGRAKSPLIHRLFAEQTNDSLAFAAVEAPLHPDYAFELMLRAFAAEGGRGASITAPFKVKACAMADERSSRAQLAGAVNTLKFDHGRILAENFDGIGLRRDIEVNCGAVLEGRRLLILGAGGAVRGILVPLLEGKPAELVVANRTEDKAAELLSRVQSDVSRRSVSYGALEHLGPFDLVINATSASLSNALPPVPPTVFEPQGMAYDLGYGRELTPFLKLARESGIRSVVDGLGMLVEQAAEAFEWWRGVHPDTQPVLRGVRSQLA